MTTTPRPNLFLVGATKSGTTSVYHALAQHPDVHAPATKEPHWLATDLELAAVHGVEDDDAYLAMFRDGGSKKYRLDGSTSSLLSAVAAERIQELSPYAQVLIILRDPLEVVPALHQQLALGGKQVARDLPAAWAHALERRGRPLRGLGWDVWTRYHDVVNYAPQVRRYLDTFPRERVHILWFDDLRADAWSTWTELQSRLSLDRADVDLTPQNRSRLVTSATVQRLIVNPPLPRIIRRLVPRALVRRIRRSVSRRNVRAAPRRALQPRLRSQLAAELRPLVDDLEDLLGVELPSWSRA